MSRTSKWEYLHAIYPRYQKADKRARQQILNEFCRVCGYHRKYAIRLLNGPRPTRPASRRRVRSSRYGPLVEGCLMAVWEAAGYPWSARLKALLPLWLPWIQRRFRLTPRIEKQL